ncbi:MAG TPA: hypothetical protein VFP61_09700 [Acidimicrobiales bacterium]|nr:hypothetical protein [Acidimicrobiales bacterium]
MQRSRPRTPSLLRRAAATLAALAALCAGLAGVGPAPSAAAATSGAAASRDNPGYWLVAADGGVYAFGAGKYGQARGTALTRPVVGAAATPDGGGYWLVASDGGIFTYGDARYLGSTGAITLNKPIVDMAPTPDGGGYWMVASDGGIFAFGAAPYLGSTGSAPGPSPIVAIAATAHGSAYPPGAVGSDYSWPQCASNGWSAGYPPAGRPVSVVGVDNGSSPYARTDPSTRFNPCFTDEATNAGTNLTVYVNVDQDQPSNPEAVSGPKGPCATTDLVCTGYNWGWNNVNASVSFVRSTKFTPTLWWLDVERPCGSSSPLWMCGTDGQASNAAVIQGAVDALHAAGLVAGIYSTSYQWPLITGGSSGNDTVTYPGLPIWIAWAPGSSTQDTQQYWASLCTNASYAFAGGTPYLIQWIPGNGTYKTPTDPFDADYACPDE